MINTHPVIQSELDIIGELDNPRDNHPVVIADILISTGRMLLDNGGTSISGGEVVLSSISSGPNLWGVLAYASLLLVFITSIEAARRKAFDFFYYSHFFFVAFFVLGISCLRQPNFGRMLPQFQIHSLLLL